MLLQDHILDLTKELSHSMSHGPHSELSEAAVFQDNKLPVSPLEGADAPEQSDGRPAPETWKNFDNVFQAHYPHITWSNEARNVRPCPASPALRPATDLRPRRVHRLLQIVLKCASSCRRLLCLASHARV